MIVAVFTQLGKLAFSDNSTKTSMVMSPVASADFYPLDKDIWSFFITTDIFGGELTKKEKLELRPPKSSQT